MTLIEHERHELARALGIAIGRRLRALRKMRGLTTVELAATTGMPRPVVSRIELGVHTPEIATIVRYCAALDVPLDAVLSVADQFAPALVRVSQLRDERGRARRAEAARPRVDVEQLLEGAVELAARAGRELRAAMREVPCGAGGRGAG